MSNQESGLVTGLVGGLVISIDDHTVEVWLLHYHPNFEYCTLHVQVGGTELGTDKGKIQGNSEC